MAWTHWIEDDESLRRVGGWAVLQFCSGVPLREIWSWALNEALNLDDTGRAFAVENGALKQSEPAVARGKFWRATAVQGFSYGAREPQQPALRR